MDKKTIEQFIQKAQITSYQWIKSDDIVIAQWVRMKCFFGCDETGRPACPPHLPTIEACRELIREYRHILIFHFEKEVEYGDFPKKWAKRITKQLLNLEREIFLSGCHKAFLLNAFSCNLCAGCEADNESCRYPLLVRPSPEALGIDVFETARNCSYPIEVLTKDSTVMNRYAIILVD